MATVVGRAPFYKRAKYVSCIDITLLIIVILRCVWVFSAPLRSGDLPLGMAQDDFFYYLKPAQNLAWHHRSVYFDHVLTNGYHPLYFALLTGLSLVVHTLRGVFRFLWLLDTASAVTTFLLVRRLFRYLDSPLLANAFGLFVTAVSIPLICDQMEVTLAVPIGIAFLVAVFAPASRLTPRRLFVAGVLAALTVLARLDAALLVLLYILGAAFTREYRGLFTPRKVVSFCAGFVPLLAIYLWTNHHYFHTYLPISGMAKELKHGLRPSVLLPASINGTTEVLANVAIIAAVLAWGMRQYLLPREKIFVFATVAFPFSFYAVEMFVSDWPIWNWYFYVLRFSCLGALSVLGVFLTRSVIPPRYGRVLRWSESYAGAALLCLLGVAVFLRAGYKIDHWMVEIQHASATLDQFASTHPGVYAMGDRAGMFGMVTSNPVLQAEGLVMDRAYLEHIRAQEDLRKVLSQYGVNYYVAFSFATNERMQFSNSCFHAMEPSIPGPDAMRMRADFCEAPIFQFPGMDGKYRIFKLEPGSQVSGSERTLKH